MGAVGEHISCGAVGEHISCGAVGKHISCGAVGKHISWGSARAHISWGAAAEQVGLKSGLRAPARLHVPAALTGKGVAARRAEEHASIMSKSQLSGLDR